MEPMITIVSTNMHEAFVDMLSQYRNSTTVVHSIQNERRDACTVNLPLTCNAIFDNDKLFRDSNSTTPQ